MHVERIRLSNYKCFAQTDIRLGKITVLLGANSSGKSSLLSGLLGALQSPQFPLLFSPNGDYATLGDFRTISHGHRKTARVGIHFDVAGHHNGTIAVGGEYELSQGDRLPTLVSARFAQKSFQLSIDKRDRYFADWTYDSSQDQVAKAAEHSAEIRELFLAVSRLTAQSRRKRKPASVPPQASQELVQHSWDEAPKSGNFSFVDPQRFLVASNSSRHFALGSQFTTITSLFAELNQRFNYIGAFRHEPVRTYYQVRLGALKLTRGGENYVHQIADWQGRGAKEHRVLQTYLRRLSLVREVRAHQLGDGRLELTVKTTKNAVKSSLVDVGFGLSQLLPVLVADLQLPKGSTLALSQPEIHLHPSVQAELAEFFADRVRKDDKRYIIETHSEYFFNRLRYLIADGKLAEDDISVVYLENEGGRTTPSVVQFHKDGRIEGAPKGFFDTYMVDAMNLALRATE